MKRIVNTDDWKALINNHTFTRNSITEYLKKHEGDTVQNIHLYIQSVLEISIKIEIFQIFLEQWDKHYTSFFQNHGRLVNLNVGDASRWFYFEKEHPYSRLHKHHHLSIIPTPKTSVSFLTIEHIFYDLLFAIPILVPIYFGQYSLFQI